MYMGIDNSSYAVKKKDNSSNNLKTFIITA